MYLNTKIKSIFYVILSFLITTSDVNAAAPKAKTVDPKLKKEKKIYEELEKLDVLPPQLSSIVSSYAAPKHIRLNFLIPNLKGMAEIEYYKTLSGDTVGEEQIKELLKKYPKLKTVKDNETIKIGKISYSYATMPEMLSLSKFVEIPLASKLVIPTILKVENLLLKPIAFSLKLNIEKDKEKEKEYLFLFEQASEFMLSIHYGLDGAFSIKLIDDLKAECQDKLEMIVTSTSDPNVALCIRKLT